MGIEAEHNRQQLLEFHNSIIGKNYDILWTALSGVHPCNVILARTYQLHGQETTEGFMLFLVQLKDFRLYYRPGSNRL